MSQTKAQLIDPVDGSLVNADINASAAIAGSKISPDFGSQNIVTTGGLTVDTNTLHVDTSNNRVGIGLTNPSSPLEISSATNPVIKATSSSSSVGAAFTAQGGSSNDSQLVLSSGTTAKYTILRDGSQSDDLRIYDSANALDIIRYRHGSYLHFGVNGSERMRIDSSGKVGINDSSPSKTLDITGEGGGNGEINVKRTSGATCLIQAQASAAVFGSSSNHITQLKSNGTTALTVDTSQNVGIGTTSPTKELDVVGEIKASGSVFTAGINAGQVGGNRNLLINGALDIWQRGTSTSTSGEYQADRFWNSNAGTYARDTSVPSDDFVYSAKLTYGSSDMAFGQPVELKAAGEASPFLPGGKCTLSFYAKTASGTEAAGVVINFRAGKFDSTNQVAFTAASGNANDLNFTATTSWQRFTFTFTVPTPHSSNVLAGLEIYGISSTIFITGVQLELGEIATAFEFRELATELTLCQRYAYVVDARGSIDNFAPIGIGRFYNSTDAQIFIPLPTTMRLPPTFDGNHTTASNTFFLNDDGDFGGAACTQLSLNERSFNAVTMVAQSIGTISGQTSGIGTTLYCDGTDDARLMLVAEF